MPEQPQRTELSEFQKGQIVALSDLYSHREIGRQLGISHSTVSVFSKRYADYENHDYTIPADHVRQQRAATATSNVQQRPIPVNHSRNCAWIRTSISLNKQFGIKIE